MEEDYFLFSTCFCLKNFTKKLHSDFEQRSYIVSSTWFLRKSANCCRYITYRKNSIQFIYFYFFHFLKKIQFLDTKHLLMSQKKFLLLEWVYEIFLANQKWASSQDMIQGLVYLTALSQPKSGSFIFTSMIDLLWLLENWVQNSHVNHNYWLKGCTQE